VGSGLLFALPGNVQKAGRHKKHDGKNGRREGKAKGKKDRGKRVFHELAGFFARGMVRFILLFWS
jgi:hypothetical protein